jgi:ketosteroid isomerase-like protein
MHAIRGIAVMAVLALASPAHAAGEKKAVEKTVKEQVAHLFAYDEEPGPYAANAELTTGQPARGIVDGDGLRAAMKDYILEWGYVQNTKLANLKVAFHDSGDAWATFTVHVKMVEDEQGDAPASFDLRAVEVLSTDDAGAWKVVAGHWARPVLDKAAKVMAEKKELGTLVALTDASPADVDDLVELLGNGGISTRVSARADVAVFGTDAMKQRLGGKKTQKAWKAWWKTVTLDGATASGMAGGGEVGWISANLAIQKGKVTIPARVFLVVAAEKGLLRVVAAVISVPQVPVSNR